MQQSRFPPVRYHHCGAYTAVCAMKIELRDYSHLLDFYPVFLATKFRHYLPASLRVSDIVGFPI